MAIKKNSRQGLRSGVSGIFSLSSLEVGTIEETTQKHQTTKARAITETETPKEGSVAKNSR